MFKHTYHLHHLVLFACVALFALSGGGIKAECSKGPMTATLTFSHKVELLNGNTSHNSAFYDFTEDILGVGLGALMDDLDAQRLWVESSSLVVKQQHHQKEPMDESTPPSVKSQDKKSSNTTHAFAKEDKEQGARTALGDLEEPLDSIIRCDEAGDGAQGSKHFVIKHALVLVSTDLHHDKSMFDDFLFSFHSDRDDVALTLVGRSITFVEPSAAVTLEPCSAFCIVVLATFMGTTIAMWMLTCCICCVAVCARDDGSKGKAEKPKGRRADKNEAPEKNDIEIV